MLELLNDIAEKQEAFCKNMSIPLEDRWNCLVNPNTFAQIVSECNHERPSKVVRMPITQAIDYDGQGSPIIWKNEYNIYLEYIKNPSEWEWTNAAKYTQAEWDAFREACCQEFTLGYYIVR